MERIRYFKTIYYIDKCYNRSNYCNSVNSFLLKEDNLNHIINGWTQTIKYINDIDFDCKEYAKNKYPQFKHLLK